MAASGNQAVSAAAYEVSPSAGERDALLRRLADLAVIPPGKMTSQERDLVDMVMASAVSRLDEWSRRRLAERIAQLPEGPAELTLALARDTIEVAELVLRNNLGLKPSDLIQIIRDAGAAHQFAIAERKALPGAIVDALIDYGSSESVCRMLANPAAEIAPRSIETLVRRSASEPAFQPLVMARPELTIRLAQLMFWWVSPEARKEILARYAIDRRMLHIALSDALEAVAVSGTDDALNAALSLVRPPVAMPKAHLARLSDLAGMQLRDEFMVEFALAGRIRPETAFRIVNDLGGEPLAVFGKATGLTRKEFADLAATVALLRGADQPAKMVTGRLAAIFDALSTDRADLVLHYWDLAISAEAQISSDA